MAAVRVTAEPDAALKGGVSGFSVAALMAGALTIVGVVAWQAVPPGIWHDDGAYLLLGQSLAEGDGLRYSHVAGAPPGAKFPPLYPLVLAVLWKIAPTAVGEGSLAGVLNLLFVIVGGGVFVSYLRSLDFSWRSSVATTAFLWLMPDVWRLSLVPLSEPLFLLALVLALWAGSRLERRPTGATLAIFLLAFAAAYHVRTMGVVLGAAVPVALLLRRKFRWAVWTGAGAVLVVTPWLVWSSRAANAIPAPLRDTLGPYGGWLTRQVGAEGAGFLAGMASSAVALAVRFAGVLFPGTGAGMSGLWSAMLILGVTGVGGVGLYRLSRESWTPILTAVLMVFLLWMWPYQDRRLIMPVAPLVGLILICGFKTELGGMIQALWRSSAAIASEKPAPGDLMASDGPPAAADREGSPVRTAVVDVGGSPARTVAVGVLGLCWIVWLGGSSLLHLRAERHLEAFEVRSRMLARAVIAVEDRVPEDGVLGAPELWAGLALHTGRTVAPSARFHPGGEGPPWGSNREQYEVWDAAGIEYVLLENSGRIHKAALDELDARCPGSVELLASWGGGLLVRLDWDQACRSEVLSAP
jgi:hypothetical protein